MHIVAVLGPTIRGFEVMVVTTNNKHLSVESSHRQNLYAQLTVLQLC